MLTHSLFCYSLFCVLLISQKTIVMCLVHKAKLSVYELKAYLGAEHSQCLESLESLEYAQVLIRLCDILTHQRPFCM